MYFCYYYYCCNQYYCETNSFIGHEIRSFESFRIASKSLSSNHSTPHCQSSWHIHNYITTATPYILLLQQPIYYRKIIIIIIIIIIIMPVPVAVRSKAWGLWLLAYWDFGFVSSRRHKYLSLVNLVCCHVKVSATARSPVQRSPTECGVSAISKLQQWGGLGPLLLLLLLSSS
jgi:hypothetical protein